MVHFFVPSTEKTFHRGSTDYFVNARKGDIGAFDSPKFIGLPVGEVLKVAKDHLDVAVTEPLANGDGLNVLIKREVVGFRANTVEKTGENQYRVWPNEMPADLHKIRPHHPLNRNLDHNWQQALTKTSSERRVAVDIELGGWQEQLILTLTSEEGVSITHTLDGQFDEANNAEKAMNNLKDGLAKLGQTLYYARDVQINLPGALFVPNSLLNQFRREAADMLDAARLASYQRGSRKPVADPAPVYPQTHLSFLANVYNQKAREFYHRYGVQLIDAAYEAHEEKGEVPVMITKHCLRFAFNLCPKQAKGNIKSWKATPMQLVNGDEVLTLKFDCRPCEMHVIGKIKNHILKMPLPGSVVASVSPDELLKTLPKRKKIFVTLNTILHDDELEPAQRLITDLYQTGVDALIVQDMGILELDIPPIELHASTQCDIRTVEKAKFLSDVGFTQIVLARELNLDQIRAIHQATDATIEFFIHGALCVAYSGQCYISHAQTGRSANRGDCSQACRLPYTLKDDQGRVVSYEKHLLSMKDNDQTANLGALIDAGVRSFKIEGRYKDMSYVKNITAHYRQMLDAIIEERGDLARASSGRTEQGKTPVFWLLTTH